MKKIFPLLLMILFLFSACKRDSGNKPYDRSALVNTLGTYHILPAYDQLKTSSDSLLSAVVQFNLSQSQGNLDALRRWTKQSWICWMRASAFEMGPAETVSLRTSLNTFPTDTTKILSNITMGTWDLDAATNFSAKGFPALDYLLWGTDSVVALSRFFTSPNRRSYLNDVVTDMSNRITQVRNAWQPAGGNYIATFLASLGTDVGSSTGMFVNQFNYELELLKNPRIGIPLGKKSLGTPMPEKCEAVYGGFSLELTQAQLASLENLFRGIGDDLTDRYSLDDAADAVEAKYNHQPLKDVILARFTSAKSALSAIPSPLSGAVVSSSASVDSAYNEITQLVILTKSDLASALAILITYQDTDGD